MRPRKLVSVRAARERRLAVHGFRLADRIALAAITLVAVGRTAPGPLASAPISRALPLAVGAYLLARLLPAMNAYRFGRRTGVGRHLLRVCSAIVVAVGVVLVADAVVAAGGGGSARPSATAWWAVVAGASLIALHTVWWYAASLSRKAGWLTPNIVIVGATEYAEAIIRDALACRHVNVLGIFDDRVERSPSQVLGVPVLGDVEQLLQHRIMPSVDRIVIAVQPRPTQRVLDIADRLAALPNDITFFTADEGSATRRAAITRLADEAPLGPGPGLRRREDIDRSATTKRLQDLLLGIPLLTLAAPLLLILAVLVKLDSRGTVFFRQRRHGFNNEEILVWKFRSMHPPRDDDRNEQQVVADDARITRVGRILRRTSLDELPQLINVVRGEMSLVGPRPHAIGMKTGDVESAALVTTYAHRHRIKPGMTGWAAVNGSRGPLHAAEDVRARVALDLEYINRHSLGLDLSIIIRTLPTMLGDRSAVR